MDNSIFLSDESGVEIEFEFLDLIDYNQKSYLIVLPVEDQDHDEPGMVVILRVESINSDNGQESYVSVESDDELAAVFSVFRQKHIDEYDFVD